MKLAGDTPTVLLPIEIAARELDSKLVLASALAAEGCRVIVAQEQVAESVGRASRRIVMQGKEFFSETRDIHPVDRLIANESAIMYHHDEGGIFQARSWAMDVLQKHQVDKLRKRTIDRVCLWGERQVDVLSAHAAELGPPSAVTGSPRFDICSPDFAWLTPNAPIVGDRTIGPYILACTRFTMIAHAEGPHSPFRRKLNLRVWPDGTTAGEMAQHWFAKWRQDVRDFADFVLLVKEIAVAFPEHRVVLRPHPSESLTFYRAAFSGFANVVVMREGSALDWIRSAELVVHSNCTTGIEAALAGRRVVNFLPGGPERAEFDIEVAREAGVPAHTTVEALETIAGLLAARAPEQCWSERACSVLNNLRARSIPLLVKQTMDVLRERRIDASRVAFSTERTLRSIARRIVKGADPYTESKLGRLSAAHVERVLDGCRSRGIGQGRLRRLTGRYAVIDP